MKNINKRKEISIAQAKEIKSECKFLDDEICYIEDIDVEDLPSEKTKVKCIILFYVWKELYVMIQMDILLLQRKTVSSISRVDNM